MTFRLAINGYGRIGQSVVRALYENGYRDHLQIVAINELTNIETLAYLTRYDTTHGRFPASINHDGNRLFIAGDPIEILNKPNPANIDWKALNIDLVLECSGSFKDRHTAELHLESGAPRLMFSQPAQSDVDATIVYGINEETLKASDRIISSASCTTNCIVPVIKTLNDALGIDYGSITTIHSAMNDQPVIDAYHKRDLRLTRSALQSIIPVDTGLAKGIDRLLPDFQGRFDANSIRVPTINVSCMDLCVHARRETTTGEVNRILETATHGRLEGIMAISSEPHASVDFNHDARSCIVDGSQTKVTAGKMIKLLCWFDNEWGFSNRMLDIASYWLKA